MPSWCHFTSWSASRRRSVGSMCTVNSSHHGSSETSGLYRRILSVSVAASAVGARADLRSSELWSTSAGGRHQYFRLHRDVGTHLHRLVLETIEPVVLTVRQGVLQPVRVVAERVVLAEVGAAALGPCGAAATRASRRSPAGTRARPSPSGRCCTRCPGRRPRRARSARGGRPGPPRIFASPSSVRTTNARSNICVLQLRADVGRVVTAARGSGSRSADRASVAPARRGAAAGRPPRRNAAMWAPPRRPNTTMSRSEFVPRRLAPWTLTQAHSPAA